MAAPDVICSNFVGGCQPTNVMGVLVLNGVTMLGPAWTIKDLRPLWLYATRGKNVRIPHLDGERAYPRRKDTIDHTLEMWLSGVVDETDAPYGAGYMQGLYANIGTLKAANILDPPAVPTATIPASLWTPDLTTELTAEIQIVDFAFGKQESELTPATLDIRIPLGLFA